MRMRILIASGMIGNGKGFPVRVKACTLSDVQMTELSDHSGIYSKDTEQRPSRRPRGSSVISLLATPLTMRIPQHTQVFLLGTMAGLQGSGRKLRRCVACS
jgi:hypothetical protein